MIRHATLRTLRTARAFSSAAASPKITTLPDLQQHLDTNQRAHREAYLETLDGLDGSPTTLASFLLLAPQPSPFSRSELKAISRDDETTTAIDYTKLNKSPVNTKFSSMILTKAAQHDPVTASILYLINATPLLSLTDGVMKNDSEHMYGKKSVLNALRDYDVDKQNKNYHYDTQHEVYKAFVKSGQRRLNSELETQDNINPVNNNHMGLLASWKALGGVVDLVKECDHESEIKSVVLMEIGSVVLGRYFLRITNEGLTTWGVNEAEFKFSDGEKKVMDSVREGLVKEGGKEEWKVLQAVMKKLEVKGVDDWFVVDEVVEEVVEEEGGEEEEAAVVEEEDKK